MSKQNGAFPKISIVTPSFNQGQFIEQTIKSIIDQQYPNLEYIIIDGGSTDDTVKIIKKYEDRLAFWVSEKDKGQSDAINKGIAHCTGDIFNWINSDDYLEPKSLFTIAEEYQKRRFTAICGCVNVVDDTKFSHIRKQSYLEISTENSIANFNINQEGTWWSLAAIQTLNGVNTCFQYTMDLDLWIRALSYFPFDSFRKIDCIVSNYRRHEAAKSTINKDNDLFESKFRKEELTIFNQFIPPSAGFSSYFSEWEVVPTSYPLDLPPTSISVASKQTITELYLFKWMKLFFYLGDRTHVKKCVKLLSGMGNGLNLQDIRYFRRKIILNRLQFWK